MPAIGQDAPMTDGQTGEDRTDRGHQSHGVAARIGFGLLAAQLVGMLAFSTVQYARWGLNNDFGGYAQAWHLIGRGELNPYVSLFRTDFLHNNLEFALYPIAWLGRLFHYPVMLSWAQDLALVATEAVTLSWVSSVVETRLPAGDRTADLILITAAVAFAANPWSWETAAFPLHFQAFAALFAVLSARALSQGKMLSLFLWAPLAITSESLGGLYLAVAGTGAALSRRSSARQRLLGLGAAAIGLGSVALVSSLGLIGRNSSTLGTAYGYLLPANSAHPGLGALLRGLFSHPGAATSTLGGHLVYVVGYLLAGGVLGLASSWGASAVVLVLIPNALSDHLPFIAFPGAFQSWAAQPFLVVGSATVAITLIIKVRRGGGAARRKSLAVTSVAIATAMATLSAVELSTLSQRWLTGPTTATELAAVYIRMPPEAQVVADQNVIGRFAEGRAAYDYVHPSDLLPVVRRQVVLILGPPIGSRQRSCLAHWKGRPGTRVLYSGKDVAALLLIPARAPFQPCP